MDYLKKIKVVLIISLLIVISISAVSYANQTIKICVNGKLLNCNVDPIIIEGTTLVPLRTIFEALNIKVDWDQENQAAIGSKQDFKLYLPINKKYAIINEKKVELDVAATVIKGNTMVPVRFIAESTGETVDWDAKTRTVIIGGRKPYIPYDKSKTGKIKGTITWQYNEFIGTKPDVGAKIALIPANLTKNTGPKHEIYFFALTLSSNSPETTGIYTTKANGYGEYEMNDVPAGEYYILIVSQKTRSDLTINKWDALILQEIFSEDEWKVLQLNLKLNKYEFEKIEIKENKVIDVSHDFGYTYF